MGRKEKKNMTKISLFSDYKSVILMLILPLFMVNASFATQSTVQEDILPIFGYYKIAPDSKEVLESGEIRVSDFENQVRYATEELGCSWYTLADITENYIDKDKKVPEKACVLTLDKGLIEQYNLAYPILEKYDINATFYIVAQRVKMEGYMDHEQLKELESNGHEIGSFSMTHPHLNELSYEEQEFEIAQSKYNLEYYGYDIKTFAYPYGDWNNDTINILKKYDYIAARDIEKDNTWRVRAPLTISAINDDFKYHMYYYKAYESTNEEIKKELFYSGWYQFEEEYKIIKGDESSIFPISKLDPTSTSYATMHLENENGNPNEIQNAFYVRDDGEYKIKILGYTGYKTPNNPYERLDRTQVFVDDKKYETYPGSENECSTVWDWHFCPYLLDVNLTKGKHHINILAEDGRIRIDKFSLIKMDGSNNGDTNNTDGNNNNNGSGTITYKLVPIQEDILPIFGYHYVIDDNQQISEPTLEIHKSDFEDQIKFATEELNCNWITFGDAVKNYIRKDKKLPKKACVLTFDDGKLTDYENALPILEKYNAKATFFIITDRVGGDGYMTWNQIEELKTKGHEIAAHTRTHAHLDTGGLTYDEIVEEINGSKKILEENGYITETFAYPFGEWNEEVIGVVKESEFLAGRDISKPNTWRKKTPNSCKVEDGFDYLYNMYYYKPEKATLNDLEKELFYEYWWQIEEDYMPNYDIDDDINTISYLTPTDTSYGSVELPDTKDSIDTSFMVHNDGNYVIEIYGYTGYEEPFNRLDRTNIFIDGKSYETYAGNENLCEVVWGSYYCPYTLNATLDEGKHIMTIESDSGRIRVDKFRMFEKVVIS